MDGLTSEEMNCIKEEGYEGSSRRKGTGILNLSFSIV